MVDFTDQINRALSLGSVMGEAVATSQRVARNVASRIPGLSGARLELVSYEATISGGPNPDWHVRRFHLIEALSEPYELVLELLTEELYVETDALVGADVDLVISRASFERHVHGVIDRVDFQGISSGRLGVRITAVPAFKLLTQQVDTRIFQDRKVPEILDEVLSKGLAQYGRKVDVSRLNDTYLVRDYCIQYGESDFTFASRLMQEEGISYFFEAEIVDGKETGVELMILADQSADDPNADFPEIEGEILDQIPIVADQAEQADCESLRCLEWSRPQEITKVTTRRFNWKRPDPEQPPGAEQGSQDARGRIREIYVPDDMRRIEDLKSDDWYGGTDAAEDEEPLTRKRLEMLTGTQSRGQGASNVTCMRAGGLFELAEHPLPALSFSKLLLTRVVHFGDCAEQEMGAEAAGEQRYQNTFECIPACTMFRMPATAPRPRVLGPQTATVTGPAGEEIHTDSHGRIKVKFHWDRLSPANETSSCWVRVAQVWAGLGWGTWFVPRIGMEVIVEFLDGNPDRPIVIGCVYNGANGTPYPLPAEKTKSTIKTNSSLGGGGFNELRFEDAKGREEIYLHAQKDHNRVVLSDRSASIGGNDVNTISGNQSITIHGAPVHGKELPSAKPGRKTSICGHEHSEVTETVYIKAGKSIVFEVGGSTIEIYPTSIKVQSGGSTVELDSSEKAQTGIKVNSDLDIRVNGRKIFLNS